MIGNTSRRGVPYVLVLAMAAARLTAADPADSLPFVYDCGTGCTVPYRLFHPPGYDPAVSYPLVVYLHDETRHGTDNLAQITGAPVDALIDACGRYGSFLLAPQAPAAVYWYEMPRAVLVSEILNEVVAGWSVDEQRIYLTGNSYGGFGAMEQLQMYSRRYAAAVWTDSAIEGLDLFVQVVKDVPVWIFHGALDSTYLVEWARALVQKLRDAGGDPRYTEYPDLGHDAASRAYEEEELYPWLFSQVLARWPEALPFVHDDGAGNTMLYRLFLPPGYDPASRYPLVLSLHGAGERGRDNLAQTDYLVMDLIAAAGRYGFFLLAPQLPRESEWTMDRFVDLVSGVLDDVESGYSVDGRRVYVTGFSLGGWGTLAQISRFPERFAAAVPIASGLPEATAEDVAAFAQVPIWVFHNTDDPVVAVQWSRDLVAALRAAGGSPRYSEYPDGGHSPFHAYQDEEDQLYPWLLGQSLGGPKAAFDVSEGGAAPAEVCFDAGASTPGDGAAITRFQWDFGDGASAEGAAPCHTYVEPGCYQVALTVVNDLGYPGTARSTVTVRSRCEREDVAPWTAEDIGGPVLAGAARLLAGGGGLAVCAGGKALAARQETLHFVHREVSGDVVLTARIASLAAPARGGQVGVMLRESLAPDARCAAVVFTTGSAGTFTRLHCRDAANGLLRMCGAGPSGGAPDLRLRIAKRADEFLGFASTDGVAWTLLCRKTIPDFSGTFRAGINAGGADPAGGECPLHLQAELADVSLVDCGAQVGIPAVTRTIETNFCASPPVAAVTLEARGIAGPTTIVETLPASGGSTCPAVEDAGGGVVEGNAIRFTLETDADITYLLDVTKCCLAGTRLDFRGDAIAETGCSSEVAGDSSAKCCPCEGDTLCTGLAVTGPEGNGPGAYLAFATAEDASGDPITYLFTANGGPGRVLTAGPQPESTAGFDLDEGTWAISVLVDDDPYCPDSASDAACTVPLEVPPGGLRRPGDCNGDGFLDISDGVATLGFLFLGSPTRLPCGDGSAADPANLKLCDVNGDAAIDLSDPVWILSFLFLGGKPPVLGTECVRIAGCSESAGCR